MDPGAVVGWAPLQIKYDTSMDGKGHAGHVLRADMQARGGRVRDVLRVRDCVITILWVCSCP